MPQNQTRKGKTHREQGIRKRASTPIYAADILADTEIRKCTLATRGAWYESFLRICRDDTDRIEGTYDQLARLWGCTLDEARAVVTELSNTKTCSVTVCNNICTLINRRRNRMLKEREKTRKRVANHRIEKRSNGNVTGHVTTCNTAPSSSLSSSVLSKDNTSPHAPHVEDDVLRKDLENQERSGSLPLPASVYEKHPPLKILHKCPVLRGITLEVYLACKRSRSPHLDFARAAQHAVDKAELEIDIRMPGRYLDRRWSEFEEAELPRIEKAKAKSVEMKRELRDLAKFIIEMTEEGTEAAKEAIQRQRTRLGNIYGKGFLGQVDKLVTIDTLQIRQRGRINTLPRTS